METNTGVIKNIQRTDINEPLFKSVAIGETPEAHVWTEVQLSDSSWIPVDASTMLVGDTPEGLQIFKDANYLASTEFGLHCQASPLEVSPWGEEPRFQPAEATAKGTYSVLLNSTRPILSTRGEIPPTNTPYSGPAELRITTNTDGGHLNLSFLEVK